MTPLPNARRRSGPTGLEAWLETFQGDPAADSTEQSLTMTPTCLPCRPRADQWCALRDLGGGRCPIYH
ncbi:hypothetical protein MES5069_360174 [Mesorhizobium escarrei]|uniref:Uncharacterized protein n=1 Tax=Mesorhizobium escarrei TaxID=666018 RepID=A0ABM9E348_9HYPH|nr:hypothetical protein MES5069_360174 [Mesorhizobium escarrei]